MEGKGNKLVFQQNATKYVAEQVTGAEIPRRPQETVSASPQDSASENLFRGGGSSAKHPPPPRPPGASGAAPVFSNCCKHRARAGWSARRREMTFKVRSKPWFRPSAGHCIGVAVASALHG